MHIDHPHSIQNLTSVMKNVNKYNKRTTMQSSFSPPPKQKPNPAKNKPTPSNTTKQTNNSLQNIIKPSKPPLINVVVNKQNCTNQTTITQHFQKIPLLPVKNMSRTDQKTHLFKNIQRKIITSCTRKNYYYII